MLKQIHIVLPLILASIAITSCSSSRHHPPVKTPTVIKKAPVKVPVVHEKRTPKKVPARRIAKSRYSASFNDKLSNAALGRLRSKVRYDGSYVKIAYPNGDVSPHTGVCTDVVIRSYRKLGIDLQEQVHRDMSAAFHTYPNPSKWGLSKPDANIDHRRVYNLRKFFERRGASLPITHNPRNYKPGDIVSWMVGADLPHIGVVVNKRSKADPNRLMIVHNIAHGPQMEDVLFAFPITGHYRYTPNHMDNIPNTTFTQNKRGMSYEQLVQAANILGTRVNNGAQTNPRSQAQVRNQSTRLNSANQSATKRKGNSVALANLSNAELQSLLKK